MMKLAYKNARVCERAGRPRNVNNRVLYFTLSVLFRDYMLNSRDSVQQARELISARKTSYKNNSSKGLSRLR